MKTRGILIKYRVVIAMIFILIPVSAVFTGITATATKNIEGQVAEANLSGLQLYHNIFQNELLSAESFMIRLVYGNENFYNFSLQVTHSGVVREIIPLVDMLNNEINNNPDVAAYILYHSPTGQMKSVFNNIASYTDIRMEIEEIARARISEDEKELGWFLVQGTTHSFFCRLMEQRGSYVLVFMDLDQAVKNYALLYEQKGQLVFFNGHGVLANGDFINSEGIELDYSSDADYYFSGSHQSYMIVGKPLVTMKMAAVVPYERSGSIHFLYMSPYIYCLAAIMALAAAIWYLRRTVLLPMEDLIKTMEKLQDGDLSTRLKAQGGREFHQVQTTFNSMVDELSNLRIKSYEQQLEIARGKLNFLRMQIRPHFYLNCLKSIFGLAQAGKMESIQQAVLYLSSHLRYVFDVRSETIPLEKELDMCENYIKLQQECECGCPEIHISLDRAAAQVPVPPVSLLTIVENCVKHGMARDGSLAVTITAKLLHIDAQTLVDIIINDNGNGFDEASLKLLNASDSERKKLGGIGVGNIVERFHLLYGEACSVRFYNKNGGCVEFLFEICSTVSER